MSDRYLEHPDISCALRTGYPRWWQDELEDESEDDESEEDEEE